MKNIATLLLAAGKGTRMKSDLPKVLHPLAGKPMVIHLMEAIAPLKPSRTVLITGFGASQVEAEVKKSTPHAEFAHQAEQLGTAHAVRSAESLLGTFEGTILVAYADAPLIPTEALQTLLNEHESGDNAVTELTTTVENPFGFGRIVRDASGAYVKTVEEKDCTEEERAITEVSTCLYAFKSPEIWPLLARIDNNNPKGEYYLTRIMTVAKQAGLPVSAVPHPAGLKLLGVNSPEELAAAETLYRKAS